MNRKVQNLQGIDDFIIDFQSRSLDLKTIRYSDVTISVTTSQITSLTIVYSAVYSGADQRKYQSSASLAIVRGIYRWLVNPHTKGQ